MKTLTERTNRIIALMSIIVLLASSIAVPLTYHVRIVEADTTTVTAYTSTGTTSWTCPDGVTSVEVLVVGGGGAGGGSTVAYQCGGGGGAGGVRYNASYPVSAGTSYTVTVGAGGTGDSGQGNDGGSSVFGTITSAGGGGGGDRDSAGNNGGSGGGGGLETSGEYNGGAGNTPSTSPSQGNSGARSFYTSQCDLLIWEPCFGCCYWRSGGGGGGAGAAGTEGTKTVAPNGGAGVNTYSALLIAAGGIGQNIGGVYWVGGGGGGGTAASSPQSSGGNGGGGGGGDFDTGSCIKDGCDATANTGGGGGGAYSSGSSQVGGDGGSGAVIIKYTKHERNLTTTAGTGGTVSTPGIGTYTYGHNQVVSIVATPSSCYAFLNWSGNGSGAVANVSAASTTITMSNHYAIQANFKWNCWYLTTSSTDGGDVTTPTPEGTSGPYADGQVVTINATADQYWAFVNWTGSGVTAGKVANASASLTTITMNGNYSVTANFRYNAYNLTTSSGTGGTVTTPGIGTYPYTNGSAATIIATADSCYAFVNWSGDTATIANPNAASTTITMNGNKSITANFRWNCYNLSTTSGDHGSVTTPGEGEYTYAYNQVVNLVATPDYCYAFDYWSGNTSTIANTSAASTTITMTENLSIQANFKWGSCYNLTVSSSSGGTVTSPGIGTYPYPYASVVNLVANKSACYSFDYWSGNVSTIPDVLDATTNITLNDNYTIQSNFARNTTILTLSSSNSSRGTPYTTGSNPFDCGDVPNIYANTSPGYIFVGWTPTDGISNPTQANTSVLMTQNRNIVAYYDPMGTPVPSTPTPGATPINGSSTTTSYLSWHIAAGNFTLNKSGLGFIKADILSGITTSNGKYVDKQLTIYIRQRPVTVGLGRGGIWGDNPVVGLSGLTIEEGGETNLFSGDIYVNGIVSVKGAGNMVSGKVYCTTVSATGDGEDFQYTYGGTCPELTFPNIGIPQEYFLTPLTAGTTDWDLADERHEYVFTSAVTLNNVDEVWENDDPDTHQLKDGYYYSNVSITLNSNAAETRGDVTFIAPQIIINNQTSGWGWLDDQYYIGLTPWDPSDLLLWSTGDAGQPTTLNDGDIMIKGSSGLWNPCVRLEGVLFAPDGEIELQGTGSTLPSFAKAVIHRGAIEADQLTIYGSDWWIYRW